MKISVITATYNSEKNLEKCLSSLYSQTYKNFEHIIIDNKSTDMTHSIINNTSFKDRKFICEKDNGIYYALNKGIDCATGDVICVLHSDDFLPNNNVFQNVVDKFKETQCDGLYGDLQYVSGNKTIRYWKSNKFKKMDLDLGWMPPHPTLYLKKKVFTNIRYNTKYKISSDYDFIQKVFQNFELYYSSLLLCVMNVGGESNKSIKNILVKMKEDLQIIHENELLTIFTLACKNLRKIHQFWSK